MVATKGLTMKRKTLFISLDLGQSWCIISVSLFPQEQLPHSFWTYDYYYLYYIVVIHSKDMQKYSKEAQQDGNSLLYYR
jgi:hypothetical protein